METRKKRTALTREQQSKLVAFFKEYKGLSHHYNLIVFLLGTGCRIGEALGLTWADIDFTRGIISIQRTMIDMYDTEKYTRYLQTPKTNTSKRELPMFSEVREALIRQREQDFYIGNGEGLDGYNDFVFRNNQGEPLHIRSIGTALRSATNRINAIELETAKEEKREPDLMPNVSPHILRHTFCTRLCEVENNMKLIQSLMGHSSINVTMNIYAECTKDFKEDSVKRLDGVFMIS